MGTKPLGVLAAVAGLVAVYWALRPRGTVPGATAPASFADGTLGVKAPKASAITLEPVARPPATPAEIAIADNQAAYVPGTYGGGLEEYLPPVKTDWTPDQLEQTYREEVGAAWRDQAPTLY